MYLNYFMLPKGVRFMGIIKILGNLLVLALSISYFGALSKVTYELGKSALSLHEKGMVSLGKFNRRLVGETR